MDDDNDLVTDGDIIQMNLNEFKKKIYKNTNEPITDGTISFKLTDFFDYFFENEDYIRKYKICIKGLIGNFVSYSDTTSDYKCSNIKTVYKQNAVLFFMSHIPTIVEITQPSSFSEESPIIGNTYWKLENAYNVIINRYITIHHSFTLQEFKILKQYKIITINDGNITSKCDNETVTLSIKEYNEYIKNKIISENIEFFQNIFVDNDDYLIFCNKKIKKFENIDDSYNICYEICSNENTCDNLPSCTDAVTFFKEAVLDLTKYISQNASLTFWKIENTFEENNFNCTSSTLDVCYILTKYIIFGCSIDATTNSITLKIQQVASNQNTDEISLNNFTDSINSEKIAFDIEAYNNNEYTDFFINNNGYITKLEETITQFENKNNKDYVLSNDVSKEADVFFNNCKIKLKEIRSKFNKTPVNGYSVSWLNPFTWLSGGKQTRKNTHKIKKQTRKHKHTRNYKKYKNKTRKPK